MVYGYCRCSTNETKQDITRQERELREMGATAIYLEYESGAKADRQKLNEMLDAASSGDTIVTTEISRITRSTKQLCDIIETVKSKRLQLIVKGSITVNCIDGEMDPMTKAFLQIAGVFSELERDMTVTRIKSGIENAKAKGKIIGRPKTTADDIPALFYRHYPKYKSGDINKKEFSRLCNLSYPTIYKYLAIVESG